MRNEARNVSPVPFTRVWYTVLESVCKVMLVGWVKWCFIHQKRPFTAAAISANAISHSSVKAWVIAVRGGPIKTAATEDGVASVYSCLDNKGTCSFRGDWRKCFLWNYCIQKVFRDTGFSGFVHRPDSKLLKTHRFGNWMFPSSGEGRRLLCCVP
jgi:hypothetical protein